MVVRLRRRSGDGPAEDEATRRSAGRFSSAALLAVAVVAVTGAVQGIRQTAGLDGIRDTSYGRLLVAKVIGVAVLLVLAVLSRAALRARDDGTLEKLRQSVAGEAAMAVVVLAVTSLLVAADPARSEEPTVFSATRVVDTALVEVIVAPARSGPVDVHVYVSDPAGGLVAADGATGTLSLPSRQIEGIAVPLRPAGRNHFSAYDLDVPISGDWRLDVEVRFGELTARSASFTVPVE
jgi:copper transport protein